MADKRKIQASTQTTFSLVMLTSIILLMKPLIKAFKQRLVIKKGKKIRNHLIAFFSLSHSLCSLFVIFMATTTKNNKSITNGSGPLRPF